MDHGPDQPRHWGLMWATAAVLVIALATCVYWLVAGSAAVREAGADHDATELMAATASARAAVMQRSESTPPPTVESAFAELGEVAKRFNSSHEAPSIGQDTERLRAFLADPPAALDTWRTQGSFGTLTFDLTLTFNAAAQSIVTQPLASRARTYADAGNWSETSLNELTQGSESLLSSARARLIMGIVGTVLTLAGLGVLFWRGLRHHHWFESLAARIPLAGRLSPAGRHGRHGSPPASRSEPAAMAGPVAAVPSGPFPAMYAFSGAAAPAAQDAAAEEPAAQADQAVAPMRRSAMLGPYMAAAPAPIPAESAPVQAAAPAVASGQPAAPTAPGPVPIQPTTARPSQAAAGQPVAASPAAMAPPMASQPMPQAPAAQHPWAPPPGHPDPLSGDPLVRPMARPAPLAPLAFPEQPEAMAGAPVVPTPVPAPSQSYDLTGGFPGDGQPADSYPVPSETTLPPMDVSPGAVPIQGSQPAVGYSADAQPVAGYPVPSQPEQPPMTASTASEPSQTLEPTGDYLAPSQPVQPPIAAPATAGPVIATAEPSPEPTVVPPAGNAAASAARVVSVAPPALGAAPSPAAGIVGRPKSVAVADVIQRALSSLQTAHRARAMVPTGPRIPVVMAAPLGQLMAQLLAAATDKPVVLPVLVTMRTEPNQLVITVADRASSSNGGALSLGAQPDTALALVRGLGA
ncbi:MAG: hypothetical protein LBH68_07270, partial [Bifidobacteriaceae bacterium]|nr:hypothetical protein [Bifidobacteriaceae bacterium]